MTQKRQNFFDFLKKTAPSPVAHSSTATCKKCPFHRNHTAAQNRLSYPNLPSSRSLALTSSIPQKEFIYPTIPREKIQKLRS